MFGFGQRPVPQRIFEQAKAGNLSALIQSTASFPDVAPSLVPAVRDLEYVDRDGRTALCVAAQKGNVGVARLLISKGANINASAGRRDGNTSLHETTLAANSPDMVNTLLTAGANPFIANARGSTCYDIAMERRLTSLVRRFESAAKLGAFVNVKVPGMLGFGGEFREFWVVLLQRIPPVAVPPARRVSHSQLLLFQTYNDPIPQARLWTDGAQVAMLQSSVRGGASAVLMLHHQHRRPTKVFVDVDSANRPCLFLRPSSKPTHAASLATLATCINDTTAAAAAAHRATTGGALPGAPDPGTPPQYTPTASSSGASNVESAAGNAWALASAAVSTASALAGSVLSSGQHSHSQSQSQPARPPMPVHPGTPPAPSAPPAPSTPYVFPQYHNHIPGQSPSPVPVAYGVPAAPTVPPSGAGPSTSAGSNVHETPDEPAADDEEPCIICMENKKAIGFLHQGTMHLCACRGCAQKWFQEHKTCPMCNVAADTLVPVYS